MICSRHSLKKSRSVIHWKKWAIRTFALRSQKRAIRSKNRYANSQPCPCSWCTHWPHVHDVHNDPVFMVYTMTPCSEWIPWPGRPPRGWRGPAVQTWKCQISAITPNLGTRFVWCMAPKNPNQKVTLSTSSYYCYTHTRKTARARFRNLKARLSYKMKTEARRKLFARLALVPVL